MSISAIALVMGAMSVARAQPVPSSAGTPPSRQAPSPQASTPPGTPRSKPLARPPSRSPARSQPASPARQRAGSGDDVPRSARTAALPPARSRALTLDWEQEPATLERSLAKKIQTLWSDRILRRGTTAIYVVDVVTGMPLYAVHEDAPLNPASNVKLISTATALDVLGPDWRYLTRLLGPSHRPDGTVPGDVYLVGSYDPTLRVDHLARMAGALAAAGVARIQGDLVVGDDALRDGLHQATVTVEVTGGKPGEAPHVVISPPIGLLEVEVAAETVKSGRKPSIQVQGALLEDAGPRYRIRVSGAIAAGQRVTRRHPVSARSLFTAHVLHDALRAAGIEVAGAVRRASIVDYMAGAVASDYLPVELARHESQPLRDLVALINKRSVNYLADQVVMAAGAALYGGHPTMEKAVQAMHSWLRDRAGIDPAQVLIDTGSGLSYETELTARQIVRVLRAASGLGPVGTRAPGERGDELAAAGLFSEVAGMEAGMADEEMRRVVEAVFVESLAVGGVDGTLSGRFRDLRGKVQGKTGTLTSVIALSGIVADDNDALAFAIVTNGNDHRQRNQVRRQHDEIVKALHRYLRERPQRSARAGDE